MKVSRTYKLSNEAISILLTILPKITDGSDMIWTSYETPAELRAEINTCIEQLRSGDICVVENLYAYFLPTGTFQEHAMANGWTDEYMKLAEQMDEIYEQMKRIS